MDKKKDKLDSDLIKQTITPSVYFDKLKGLKQTTDSDYLNELYKHSKILLDKAFALGQDKSIEKLLFVLNTITKEHRLLEHGVNTFVYRDDIEEFIEMVEKKTIKIVELKNYPREIPDEIADKVIDLKKENLFDEYFVVFTDYTGKTEKEINASRRDKDPILFGAFIENSKLTRAKNILDRFYYIGDWEDEYCDLTLEKMVSKMADEGKDIERKIKVPEASMEEIKAYHDSISTNQNGQFVDSFSPRKQSRFKRIKTWLSRGLK
jgi:hypothetical protein